MSDKLNLFELEPVLLAHCLKDRLFFLKIRDHIEPEYFEDENVGKIYEVIKKFNVKYNSIPEPKTIKTMFKKKFEDKAGKYLEILDVIYDLQGTYDVEFIEESTKEFIKESKVVNALKKCIPLLEEKKFGEIHEEIKKAITVDFDRHLGLNFKKDAIPNIQSKNKARIRTGYSSLDSTLSGGFEGSCLYVFSGIYGIGKSIWLQNLAMKSMLNGKNVIYYTLELSENSVIKRLTSMYSKITQKEFLTNIKDLNKQFKLLQMITGSDLWIKEYPANSATTHTFECHIEEITTISGKKPDIIYIDYATIMETLKKISSDNMYSKVKILFEEARNLGKLYDIPVVTAAQINRGGMDEKKGGTKKVVTGANLSESLGIGMTADAHFVINQTSDEQDSGEIRLFVDKNRQGKQKHFLDFDIDYRYLLIEESVTISKGK